MPEVFGLEVTVRLKTDGAKKEIGNLTKALEARLKKVTMSMPNVSNFTGGMRSGLLGGPSPAGKMAALGKMLGQVGLILGVLNVIAEGVGKMVNRLAEASLALAGTLAILNRSFSIMFRPFGDFIGLMLRPLALWLMRMAIRFLNWMNNSGVGKVATNIGEGIVTALEAFAKGLSALWDFWSPVIHNIFKALSEVFWAITTILSVAQKEFLAITTILSVAQKELKPIWDKLIEVLTSVYDATKSIWDTLVTFLKDIGSAILKAVQSIPIVGKYFTSSAQTASSGSSYLNAKPYNPYKDAFGTVPPISDIFMSGAKPMSGGNKSTSVTINVDKPTVSNKADIGNLVNEISREVQLGIRRVSGYIGGI